MPSLPFSPQNHYPRRSLVYANHNKSAAGDNTFREFDNNVIELIATLACVVSIIFILNAIVRCILHMVREKCTQPEPVEQVRPTLVRSVKWQYEYCTICLSEVRPGEVVRVLPKCSHGFHVACINRWLEEHGSCPCCRQCILDEARLVVGFRDGIGTRGMGPAQVVEGLPPELELELEDMMDNYRVCC